MPTDRVRVLVAKVGLDGHDRGARIVARALRDAGMEVVYGGLHLTPKQVARIAVEEDVDVVGLSILSGAHLTLVPLVVEAMHAYGAREIPLVCGGVIPDDDARELRSLGVVEVIDQEAPLGHVVDVVRSVVHRRDRKMGES
ncbi:MAG TPA: cobalamin B12-binding domain-containing protein [Acidimicrobiia bacterium]|nr:cobalamin B12-binding domain-containing protein [Acidimicrobiia bacterium]